MRSAQRFFRPRTGTELSADEDVAVAAVATAALPPEFRCDGTFCMGKGGGGGSDRLSSTLVALTFTAALSAARALNLFFSAIEYNSSMRSLITV